MRFEQERSDRPDPARRRNFQTPEELESRQLLSSGLTGYFSLYTPSDLYVTNPITHQRESISYRDLMQHNNPNSALLSNEGKIVSGTDRAGDVWTITVHGPGKVIVTDTTPNDGSLDDDIATIQIVNSSLTSTYVTGTVVASNRVLTSGTVLFDRLIATSGVRSIELNGFNLSANVTPAVNQTAGIFLYGGVQTLSFNDVLGLIDTSPQSSTPQVYQIQIGDASTPISVKPSIFLDSVYNSVFDSSVTPTSAGPIPTGPLTSPSVIFSVNGVVQNFSVVSMTQSPVPPNYIIDTQQGTTENWTGWPKSGPVPAGFQFFYNIVGTTGRTTLQASAINHLNVVGKATNFTAQRDTQPFQSSLSGLNYFRSAKFGANADAVALDVKGRIGKLTFKRGLGDPSYVFNAKQQVTNQSSSLPATTVYLPATEYGVPLGSEGYPAHGLEGGVITAKSIRSLKIGPANYTTLTAQNPIFVQTGQTGYATAYLTNPGTAVTNAAITTTGSIGSVKITGNQLNTEIKTGFDYQSYLAGLEGTRSASRIARIKQRGDLVSSVDSATFRPAKDKTTGNSTYSFNTGTAGPGSITGTITGAVGHGRDAATYSKTAYPGAAYPTGGRTALGNYGAGFFARRRSANLPPPR
ncbi:MAG: hypothetical protein ACLP7Q_25495 [Isosphaeraceae bacterium]